MIRVFIASVFLHSRGHVTFLTKVKLSSKLPKLGCYFLPIIGCIWCVGTSGHVGYDVKHSHDYTWFIFWLRYCCEESS